MLFQVLATAEHHIYDKFGTVAEALYVALRYHCLGQHSLHIRYVVQQLLIVSRQPFLQSASHLKQLQTSLCIVGVLPHIMLTRYDVSVVYILQLHCRGHLPTNNHTTALRRNPFIRPDEKRLLKQSTPHRTIPCVFRELPCALAPLQVPFCQRSHERTRYRRQARPLSM